MIKSEEAVGFNFIKYRISKFSFNETENDDAEFDLSFNPAGVYNQSTGEYELTVTFQAHEKDSKKLVIEVSGIAEYKFNDTYTFEQLPSHFFLSAVPIFFPYLRAFVSTLTLQANSNVMVLGLINFTNMSAPLKANTKVI